MKITFKHRSQSTEVIIYAQTKEEAEKELEEITGISFGAYDMTDVQVGTEIEEVINPILF